MTGEGTSIARRIRAAVDEGSAIFAGVSEERTALRPAPGQWCAREVLGHLIDSACNNERRFVMNQDAERLLVDPYNQESWVVRHGYAETPVAVLVPAWAAYNGQIARLVERIPEDVLCRPRGPSSGFHFPYLDYAQGDMVTLRDLIEDYVGHMHHHFPQLRRLLTSDFLHSSR